MKVIYSIFIYFLMNFNFVFSSEELAIDAFFSAIKDDGIRNRIKSSIDKESLVFFYLKNNYGFMAFPKEGDFVYSSSVLGNFKGKFNFDFPEKIKNFFEQSNNAQLSDKETKIVTSVRDGLVVIVSQNGGHCYLSDPVLLFLSQDENYSEKMNMMISSILQILFETSKFDVTIHKYLCISVDDFDDGFENFSDFLVNLKKQREEHQKLNK